MRIPYGFILDNSGTLEINKREADNVALVFDPTWQVQVWERLQICFFQNKYRLRLERQNGLVPR